MLRKNFTSSRPCPTWPRAHKLQRQGHIGIVERAHGGQRADTWWTHTRQTEEAHTGWTKEARPQQRTIKCGDAAKADTRRTHSGHKADTWRASSGDAARGYRGQPLLRENPTVNCLGKNAGCNDPNSGNRVRYWHLGCV